MNNCQDYGQYPDCTNLSAHNLNTLNLVRGACGLICMLTAILVFVILLRFYCVIPKTQRHVTKRLILFLTAFIIFFEATMVLQLEHQFCYSGQADVCVLIGFLTSWMNSVEDFCTAGISVYLLFIVCRTLTEKELKLSSTWKIGIEVLFYFMSVLLPLIYLWVPFSNTGYGLNGYYCWVRTLNGTDCSPINGSRINLGTFVGISNIFGIIKIVCLCIVVGVYLLVCCCKQLAIQGVVSLLQRTLVVMVLLIARLASQLIFEFWIQEFSNIWWTYLAVSVPLTFLIDPLGFLAYVCTIGKKKIYCNSLCKNQDRPEMPADLTGSHTHHQSKKDYIRSYTYWSVPYTNGFTTITDQRELEGSTAELYPIMPSSLKTGYI